MLFTGQAEATIDSKSRLSLPAKFRNRWDRDRDGASWYCVAWVKTASLRLYPARTYEELFLAGRRDPSLTPVADRADLDVILHSATEQVDVDASNRIRLQSWQVEALGLTDEVVVLGAGDRLEVRSRALWKAEFKDRLGKMAELAERLGQQEG